MSNVRRHGMRNLALSILLLATALFVRAAEPFTTFSVVLMQPDHVLKQRVASVEVFAEYVRAIQAAAKTAIVASEDRPSVGGFIVVAVRPGARTNVWLEFDAPLPQGITARLNTAVRAVAPFAARSGPVVFAIKVGLWGGAEPVRITPVPAEWTAAAEKAARPLEVGELVESIWRE